MYRSTIFKLLYQFILIGISIEAFGQSNLKVTYLDSNDDHSVEIKLTEISESQYRYFIRFSTGRQTIDLFGNDSANFRGEVLNYTWQWNSSNKISLYTEIFKLKDSIATITALEFLKSKQHLMTDLDLNDDYLPCSKVEVKLNGHFYVQSPRCYFHLEDSAVLKPLLEKNYKLFDVGLKLDSLYDLFFNHLPDGCYSTYSSGSTCKKAKTKKDLRKWERFKPEYEYRESIKDSVNSKINAQLSHLDQTVISCNYARFFITIGRNGKVKKVEPLCYSSMNYLERLRCKFDHMSCKKETKKLLNNLDIKDFNLKYKIVKELHLFSDQIFVSG